MAWLQSPEYQNIVWAASDLNDGAQFIAVTMDGNVCTGANFGGILSNKPKQGETASVLVCGISKFRAATDLAISQRLSVTTSGWLTLASSGNMVVGRCMANVTSGSLGTAAIQIVAPYASSSTGAL
jgi:hypothetical protein